MSNIPNIPEAGFVRLSQILGKPKANPPLPAIIPVSKSTWWAGVKSGRYPAPVKLSERVTAWRADDIRALLGESASHGIVARGIPTEEQVGRPSLNWIPVGAEVKSGSK